MLQRLLLLAALLLAGCGGSTQTPKPSAAPSETAARSPSPAEAAPTVALGSPTVGPYGLAIDPTLLSILPPTLGDLPVSESSDVESLPLQSPDLPKHAEGYAGAVVGDLGGSDWATVSVAKLKPDSATDQYVSSWQADYNGAACEQAGGVASQETVQVAGRSIVHVTCQGGVDLYHAWLPERAEIVSVTSLGALQLGYQLMQALRS